MIEKCENRLTDKIDPLPPQKYGLGEKIRHFVIPSFSPGVRGGGYTDVINFSLLSMVPINYVAVVVSAVAAMIIGSLWYGTLFGKQWMAIMGWTSERMAAMRTDPAMKRTMMRSYAIQVVASLLMAFVLDHAVIFAASYLRMQGAQAGLLTGFMSWLGFVAPATIGGVLWEQKPWKWWYLLAGCNLVILLVMGLILGAWM